VQQFNNNLHSFIDILDPRGTDGKIRIYNSNKWIHATIEFKNVELPENTEPYQTAYLTMAAVVSNSFSTT
jgi:hypothetical protein